MIVVIGVFFVVGLMTWLINYGDNSWFNDWRDGAMILAAILLPVAVAIGLVALNWHMCTKDEIIERVDIYAGYNDSEITGRWFLLSGRVDENDVVYYWVDNDGVKSKHSQLMDDSVFIEDGGEYLLIRREACPENWRWFFVCTDKTAEFHVPENSIRQMYQYQ